MANEHSHTRLLDRLWYTIASPQSVGIALLAVAAIEALRRWQPSDETTLLLRVVAVFAIGVGLIATIERWFPRRHHVEDLARVGWSTAWSFPFFDEEVQPSLPAHGWRWRATILLYGLSVIGVPAILLLSSMQHQRAGTQLLFPGQEGVESYTEDWPERDVKRGLGIQLALQDAGVEKGIPYARLRVTDMQTTSTSDMTLVDASFQRVRSHLLSIKALRPVPGLAAIGLRIRGGDTKLQQTVTLRANEQITLDDGTTLHWDQSSDNRFSTLGRAIQIHRDRDGELLERRWLYVDFPTLNQQRTARLPAYHITSDEQPLAVVVAVRELGGPAWGMIGAAFLLTTLLLALGLRWLPLQRMGRQGDYVVLGPADAGSDLATRVDRREGVWIQPLDKEDASS